MTFVILAKYNGVIHDVDETESRRDAEFLVNEYQLAYGGQWRVWYEERTEA